ncbi:hypothetical protein [Amycolatopsis sp. NPDC059657]|uniref:hypothetical protein n=1 Tax=Amycolatopsis sp. NPDC059657 TaxID=3346899 RepID=UPI003672E961
MWLLKWAKQWPILLVAASTILIVVSFRFLLGATDWAGLGQWVGGLGAFFAAWAALDIAKGEARRENAREAERLAIQTYYVSGAYGGTTTEGRARVVVDNHSTEPILNVEFVKVHSDTYGPVECSRFVERTDVLLPGKQWGLWVIPAKAPLSIMSSGHVEIEIEFNDLGGTRWRRVGERPPEVAS